MKWNGINGKKTRAILLEGIIYAFVVLFVYAAGSKLLDFETFRAQLAQSPLLSVFAGILAWMVPLVELALAGLLMFFRTRKWTLLGAFTLMVMFTSYIYFILNFSDFVPCSCGGVLEEMTWTQHLVFNMVFMFMAGLGMFLSIPEKPKKILLLLVAFAVFGIGTVGAMFAFSEKKMHRNNAFQRRYIPHPLKFKTAIDLQYNSYYIAGIARETVFLGNVTAPLHILEANTEFGYTRKHRIKLEFMDLPYTHIKIDVRPPLFYVSDGTVPIIQGGNIANWEAHTLMKEQVYFSQFIPVDPKTAVLRTIDGTTRQYAIAAYSFTEDSVKIGEKLLNNGEHSIFGGDGQLLESLELKKMIYLYYYQNKFVVFDPELRPEHVGKTIDTINAAAIETVYIPRTDQYKVKGTTTVVNRQGAAAGDYLFIISDRLGRYEKEKDVNRATIVDVYTISESVYAFSFYIYHHKGEKVSRFAVRDKTLWAIMGKYLVVFELNAAYFDKTKTLNTY